MATARAKRVTQLIRGYVAETELLLHDNVIVPHIILALIALYFPLRSVFATGSNIWGRMGISFLLNYTEGKFRKWCNIKKLDPVHVYCHQNGLICTDIFNKVSEWGDIYNREYKSLNCDNIIIGCGMTSELILVCADYGNNQIIYSACYDEFSCVTSYNKFFNGIKILQICIGEGRTFFRSEGGIVYVIGWNNRYQCGLNHDNCDQLKWLDTPHLIKIEHKVIDMSCGLYHNLFLSENKSLYVFGGNEFALKIK